MSGGAFDYQDCHLEQIANDIEAQVLANNKTRTELHKMYEVEHDSDIIEEYPRYRDRIWIDWINPEKIHDYLYTWDGKRKTLTEAQKEIKDHNLEKPVEYSKETIKEFKTAISLLRKAAVYAHRIDWLISGDDGEDGFHERLKEDLENLNNEHHTDNTRNA